jgi:type III restriction enzyme
LHFFREPLPNNKSIRQTIFRGFRKCCYSLQKFDSAEGELRLAMILEDDNDVLKWMKPAPGQFRIEYQRGQSYEPDFVVETTTDKLIIEPKRADQMETSEVQEKTRAALRWCEYANQHAAEHNGKKWHYLLVPHNEISLGRSVSGLLREYAQ